MAYEVEVVRLQPQSTARIRFQCSPAELREVMGPTYAEVAAYLKDGGLGEGAVMYTRAHGFGDTFDLENGYTVKSPAPGRGRVQPGELPGGEAAMTELLGSYEGMPAAVGALHAWPGANGREASGGHWELYVVKDVPDDQKRTELYLPLK